MIIERIPPGHLWLSDDFLDPLECWQVTLILIKLITGGEDIIVSLQIIICLLEDVTASRS